MTKELLKTSTWKDHASKQSTKNRFTQTTKEKPGKMHSTSAGTTWKNSIHFEIILYYHFSMTFRLSVNCSFLLQVLPWQHLRHQEQRLQVSPLPYFIWFKDWMVATDSHFTFSKAVRFIVLWTIKDWMI